MLDIRTFDNVSGGNAVYKALAHPLAAERLAALAARLAASGPVAVYDPERIFAPLRALAPAFPVEGVYVHDTLALGETPAERLLWQYKTLWGRSVEPIFEEHGY